MQNGQSNPLHLCQGKTHPDKIWLLQQTESLFVKQIIHPTVNDAITLTYFIFFACVVDVASDTKGLMQC